MKLLDAIDSLKVWTRGDRRSPHKPLLLLYALAKQVRDSNAKFEFSEIEKHVHELLDEFWNARPGKPGKHHVNDPFWRLQKDKTPQGDAIWKVRHEGGPELSNSSSATVTDLRNYRATGFFSPEIVIEIRDNPDIIRLAAQKLLDKHFSESLHQSIMERVGLPYEMFSFHEFSAKNERDPKFRKNVLHAYEYSCAVCGFDLHIRTVPVGLKAVHIKWHQHRGPDTEDNGLALCATHHKLLDSGALTLSDDYRVVLSESIYSPNDTERVIRENQKKEVRLLRNRNHFPEVDYIRWHRNEVFRPLALGPSA